MSPRWRFPYERIREAHTAAVRDVQDSPDDPGVQAILRATTIALRAFRQEYQKASMASLAGQLGGEV